MAEPNSSLPVYKSADQIVAEALAAWLARFPDAGLGPDSIMRLWTEVFANSAEGLYIANQLLHDDIFIQTMSALALQRKGEELGREQKTGTISVGTLRFGGTGGTVIPSGSVVASPRASLGDVLLFETTADATIPNPGIPAAPTAADAATGGSLTGTYEYAVSFTTLLGETEIGDVSNAVAVTASRINLTAIPLGGTGTVGRKIYRRVDGGNFGLLTVLANNTTTTYADNSGAVGALPLSESTAERVDVTAQSVDSGVDFNVSVGTVTDLSDVPDGVTDVTNISAFTGGSDPEDIEAFRSAVLEVQRNPGSGAASDLVSAVTALDGIESAAVFKNVDLSGTTALGTVSIRIAGPDGAVPDAATITAAQAAVAELDLANITILVGTFTPLVIDVTVDVTTSGTYTLTDVRSAVQESVTDYINSVPVGGTVYSAGILAAAFGLPGVANVSIVGPTDYTAAATEKPVAGTITVS